MKKINGKKYTAKELAAQFGYEVRTINKHAVKLFGLGEKRKTRYFDELQVTMILESMKKSNESSQNRAWNAGVPSLETEMSEEFQLAMMYKQAVNLLQKTNELECKLRIKTETKLRETERKLGEEVVSHGRTRSGLEMYQRIAESAGLSMSDRDDMLSMYRR
jgi:hypothetical protein